MKNKIQKINYYNTYQLRRQRGELYVNLMTSLTMPKIFKQIKKLTKNEKRKRQI